MKPTSEDFGPGAWGDSDRWTPPGGFKPKGMCLGEGCERAAGSDISGAWDFFCAEHRAKAMADPRNGWSARDQQRGRQWLDSQAAGRGQ